MGMHSSSSTDEKLELCFNGEVNPYVQELEKYERIIFLFLYGLQKSLDCTLGVQVRNMKMVLTLVHLESIQAMNINDENL